MDYMFSQHDLSFLDDVIPEKDKKKKEDEKKKRSSIGSDVEDVRPFAFIHPLLVVLVSPVTPHPPSPALHLRFCLQQHDPLRDFSPGQPLLSPGVVIHLKFTSVNK